MKQSCCLRETWECRPSVTQTMSRPAIFHGSEAPGSSSVSSPAPQPPILTASQALLLGHSVPRPGSTGLVQGRAESRGLSPGLSPPSDPSADRASVRARGQSRLPAGPGQNRDKQPRGPVQTGPQSEPVDRAGCPQVLDRIGTRSLGLLSV